MKTKIKKVKDTKKAKGGSATFRKYGTTHMAKLARAMHKKRRLNEKKNAVAA